ncbi:MAG: hypothetical protein KatS3mg019_2427 [Fimbriimonadales bacterium]|nr:MAG: hypothetical protein KatS3mg019_2427 [Fimbriimonadales bacterium]
MLNIGLFDVENSVEKCGNHVENSVEKWALGVFPQGFPQSFPHPVKNSAQVSRGNLRRMFENPALTTRIKPTMFHSTNIPHAHTRAPNHERARQTLPNTRLVKGVVSGLDSFVQAFLRILWLGQFCPSVFAYLVAWTVLSKRTGARTRLSLLRWFQGHDCACYALAVAWTVLSKRTGAGTRLCLLRARCGLDSVVQALLCRDRTVPATRFFEQSLSSIYERQSFSCT